MNYNAAIAYDGVESVHPVGSDSGTKHDEIKEMLKSNTLHLERQIDMLREKLFGFLGPGPDDKRAPNPDIPPLSEECTGMLLHAYQIQSLSDTIADLRMRFGN